MSKSFAARQRARAQAFQEIVKFHWGGSCSTRTLPDNTRSGSANGAPPRKTMGDEDDEDEHNGCSRRSRRRRRAVMYDRGADKHEDGGGVAIVRQLLCHLILSAIVGLPNAAGIKTIGMVFGHQSHHLHNRLRFRRRL